MLPFRLLVIADRGVCANDDEFLDRVERVYAIPDLWLQLRAKAETEERRQFINFLGVAITSGDQTLLNGTLEEAESFGCAGAHYPEALLPAKLGDHPEMLAGASVHSVAARLAAEKAGVDYVIAGSVFAPSSKPGEGRGLEWLATMTRDSSVPVIAIGGITPQNVRDCLAAGAHGVAVLGGIFRADDPGAAVAAYRAALA